MISFAEKVLVYTEGLDQAAFVASGLNYDAMMRNLELIGEAIPVEIQKMALWKLFHDTASDKSRWQKIPKRLDAE